MLVQACGRKFPANGFSSRSTLRSLSTLRFFLLRASIDCLSCSILASFFSRSCLGSLISGSFSDSQRFLGLDTAMSLRLMLRSTRSMLLLTLASESCTFLRSFLMGRLSSPAMPSCSSRSTSPTASPWSLASCSPSSRTGPARSSSIRTLRCSTPQTSSSRPASAARRVRRRRREVSWSAVKLSRSEPAVLTKRRAGVREASGSRMRTFLMRFTSTMQYNSSLRSYRQECQQAVSCSRRICTDTPSAFRPTLLLSGTATPRTNGQVTALLTTRCSRQQADCCLKQGSESTFTPSRSSLKFSTAMPTKSVLFVASTSFRQTLPSCRRVTTTGSGYSVSSWKKLMLGSSGTNSSSSSVLTTSPTGSLSSHSTDSCESSSRTADCLPLAFCAFQKALFCGRLRFLAFSHLKRTLATARPAPSSSFRRKVLRWCESSSSDPTTARPTARSFRSSTTSKSSSSDFITRQMIRANRCVLPGASNSPPRSKLRVPQIIFRRAPASSLPVSRRASISQRRSSWASRSMARSGRWRQRLMPQKRPTSRSQPTSSPATIRTGAPSASSSQLYSREVARRRPFLKCWKRRREGSASMATALTTGTMIAPASWQTVRQEGPRSGVLSSSCNVMLWMRRKCCATSVRKAGASWNSSGSSSCTVSSRISPCRISTFLRVAARVRSSLRSTSCWKTIMWFCQAWRRRARAGGSGSGRTRL